MASSLRAPSALERWFCCHPIAHVVSFSVSIETNTKWFNEALIRKVLAHVVQAHPRLGLRYEFHNGRPVLLPVKGLAQETLPVSCHHRTSDQTLMELTNKEINTPFDWENPTVPLWRFLVIWDQENKETTQQVELLGIFHHLLTDGKSSSAIFHEFFRLFETLSNAEEEREGGKGGGEEEAKSFESLVTTEGIRPSIEDCLDISPPLSLIVSGLVEEYLSFFHTPLEYYHGPTEVLVPPEERKTSVISFTLPAEKFAPLLKISKEKGTTLHGAFVAAANFALAVTSQNPYLTANCVNPISLRKACNIPENCMGLYICDGSTVATLSPSTGFWQLAKDTKEQLNKALPKGYQRVGLLKFVGDLRGYFQKNSVPQKNGRLSSLEVSNLGQVTLKPSYANQSGLDLKILACQFGQGNHYDGPLFNTSVVTFGSSVNFCLGIATPVLPSERASAFRDVFLLCLSLSVTNQELTLQDLF